MTPDPWTHCAPPLRAVYEFLVDTARLDVDGTLTQSSKKELTEFVERQMCWYPEHSGELQLALIGFLYPTLFDKIKQAYGELSGQSLLDYRMRPILEQKMSLQEMKAADWDDIIVLNDALDRAQAHQTKRREPRQPRPKIDGLAQQFAEQYLRSPEAPLVLKHRDKKKIALRVQKMLADAGQHYSLSRVRDVTRPTVDQHYGLKPRK